MESTDNLKPLIISPPNDLNDYFEILGKSASAKMRSGLVTLMPGQDVGAHNTKNYEELIIVLNGEGQIEAGTEGRRKISGGQIAYNPPNTEHNLFNTGITPLRYIYVVSEAL